MINADTAISVELDGLTVLTADFRVRESEDNPIAEGEFTLDYALNYDLVGPDLDERLRVGTPIRVELTAGERSEVFFGDIANVNVRRVAGGYDSLRVTFRSQEDRLNRYRVLADFNGLTASEIVASVVEQYVPDVSVGSVATTDLVPNDITGRLDTALEIVDKIAKRLGWSWSVEDGLLYMSPPADKPAPFDVESGKNLIAGTLELEDDGREIRNVFSAIAYEYENKKVRQTVKACTQAIYAGESLDPVLYEVSDGPVIASPSRLSDVGADINLNTGMIEFNQPLVYETEDELPDDPEVGDLQDIDLVVTYTVRRKLLLQKRDEVSVARYGARESHFRPDSGGDDVKSVWRALDSEIRRKAFPYTHASFRVSDFGMRRGQLFTIKPGGPVAGERGLRVSEVEYWFQRGALSCSVSASSESFYGTDPVPELGARISNIEKRDLHPRSIAGKEIREVGAVSEVEEPEAGRIDVMLGEFFVIPAEVASFKSGGRLGVLVAAARENTVTFEIGGVLGIASRGLPGYRGRYRGGFELFATGAGKASSVIFDAGGRLKADRLIQLFDEASYEVGGVLSKVIAAGSPVQAAFDLGGEQKATATLGRVYTVSLSTGGVLDAVGEATEGGILVEDGNLLVAEDGAAIVPEGE